MPASHDSFWSLMWRHCIRSNLAALLLLATPLPAVANDLASHPSPYLRAHAGDAIHWRAPESDAITDARRTGMPLLVSSGYLACYWCHRLKLDTLQDPDLAALVNEYFVPVLLDRELHGADDQVLQDFLARVRGNGGWPAIAIVTPDGEPVHGWNYMPPGQLRAALERFIAQWEDDAVPIRRVAENDNAREQPLAPGRTSDDLAGLLDAFLSQSVAAADREYGGFGHGEKYPDVPRLQALLDLHQQNPSEEMAGFLRVTLDRMLAGSLVDPVEGGVFRYTENRDWSAPHFEQMLTTQALVSRLLLRAASGLDGPRYAAAARGILDNMLERFALEDGWFAAALSAVGPDDVNGGYYLVSARDATSRLGDRWPTLVEKRSEIDDRMLLAPTGPLASVTREALTQLRHEQVLQRDEKRLLSWNGLALSAFSHGAALESRFLQAAQRLSAALLQLTAKFPFAMTTDDDASGFPADLAGHVYVAGGLFDWWQVSGDRAAAERVATLLEQALISFHDGAGWRAGRTLLLHDRHSEAMLPDTQLPSPSAEWLRLADALAGARIRLSQPVRAISGQMAASWPATLEAEAFFHATLVSALVTGRLLGIH